jgi:iron complex outermembrane receptor protein
MTQFNASGLGGKIATSGVGVKGRGRTLFLSALLSCTAMAGLASAQETTASEEIVVTGTLRALPGERVPGVFGFDKTITETPRAVSTISSEQMERFGVTEIYDLVAQTPGTFTNSFFGVAGALDIRGTPGEVYFRGVRRLDNPGNYPTPLGASDRIDIVRGPASPIYGPSKTGGYMNFVPKSARSADGEYLEAPEGQVRYTGGSWNKNVLSAEVTGPGDIGGQKYGYTLYGEIEDSGSYYRNIFTKQTILQGAFVTDITSTLRAEFGTMYHDYKGVQNGGWNRLTQALVDNGTYITGRAQPLDTNGDGQLSPAEFDVYGSAANFFSPFNPFFVPAAAATNASFASLPWMAITNVGTTTLSRKNTLTGPNDKLNNETKTAYFDLIWDAPGGFEIKNQMFYEGYENLNENAYGFSQFHDSWVFEDKIVISKEFDLEGININTQLSPSIRYTDFLHGDDYFYEYFHRVDLTVGYTPLSDRLLSTECNCNYAEYYDGHYVDYGIAGLADVTTDIGLGLLLGARYDEIYVKSTEGQTGTGGSATDTDGGLSWTASVNYSSPIGLIPYFTASRQGTVIAGQGAEINRSNVAGGTWFSNTEMMEAGIKGQFFDKKLFAALAVYEQERTDYNAQSITVNQSVKTEGVEAEFRWAVTDKLLISGAYTKTKVINLTALEDGSLFGFLGIEDLVNVTNPALYLGGQPIGLVLVNDEDDARRAGIPENIYSMTATYAFDNGLSFSGSVVKTDDVFSGQSQAVTLPGYTLVDVSGSYTTDDWIFRLTVKNATDEEYFRANFTELFGSTIVLPEKPRSVEASLIYKF